MLLTHHQPHISLREVVMVGRHTLTHLREHATLYVRIHLPLQLVIFKLICIVDTWGWSHSKKEELKMSMVVLLSEYNV